MLFIAFLLWSSNFETCNARRGKHWRHSSGTSASLYKKKGKSRGSGNNHHSGGSKPKSPPHKASPLPTPKRKAPPLPTPKPKEEFPSNPPAGHSTTFNVLDFGAKGDGRTDDTKVIPNSHQMLKKICLMLLCNIYGLHANIRNFFFFSSNYKFFNFSRKFKGMTELPLNKKNIENGQFILAFSSKVQCKLLW